MSEAQGEPIDRVQLEELQKIVWGTTIRLDVFQRWSQGTFLGGRTLFNIE